ncbi:chorismate synthase [Streptomyces sp. NPDC003247]|uniref:chorismate synthase n=1 Tax=Streptomyces sp. NPDC003247 TaxID=3364677 RepID=UPI0036B294C2
MREKIALVTGAAGGIGEAVVRTLGERGASVAAVDKDADRLSEVTGKLAAAGLRVRAFPADITTSAGAERLVADVEDTLGPLDHVVNGAGVLRLGKARDLTDEDWAATFAVNTTGVFYMSRELARVPGSQVHDEIVNTPEGIRRVSGRSGGTEGGLTTGELLRVRAAMKPIATVSRALRTVDVATGEAAQAHHQRSDVSAVPAAGIVAEAMVALVLADAVAEKFGGDSVSETRRNVQSCLDNLAIR